MSIRATRADDDSFVRTTLSERWGETTVVSRGRVHDASTHPALIAERADERVGLATYRVDGPDCELLTLDAIREGIGVGQALLDAVIETARDRRCHRLWLITTNDNTRAIRFYQRRGLDMVALHRNALRRSREMKPSIPRIGADGIPIRHELEFELDLRSG